MHSSRTRKKRDIIQQTKSQVQNWTENQEEQRDVELTDKCERYYMLRAVNIEKKVKDNLRQNWKNKKLEKKSIDNLKSK